LSCEAAKRASCFSGSFAALAAGLAKSNAIVAPGGGVLPWSQWSDEAFVRAAPKWGSLFDAKARVAGPWTLAIALWTGSAHAWLFEEHANIGRLAVTQDLTASRRAMLSALWSAALAADPVTSRLCPGDPGDLRWSPTHDRTWACVDFGALPAVAGDHSCNPADLWATITRAQWFPAVYADAARTERDIHRSGASDGQIVDSWHQGNLFLQRDDAQYLSRAAVNSAHFVLARGDEDTLQDFLRRAAAVGTPLNATESYAVHHLAALAAAARFSASAGRPDAGARAIAVLSAEAFALHFLEDSFSAGHFVGVEIDSLGSTPERAGTHDYYCQHGLAARSWDRSVAYAAHGDAFETDACAGNTALPAPDDRGVVLCDPKTHGTTLGLTRSESRGQRGRRRAEPRPSARRRRGAGPRSGRGPERRCALGRGRVHRADGPRGVGGRGPAGGGGAGFGAERNARALSRRRSASSFSK
jgi:hypothetical protein